MRDEEAGGRVMYVVRQRLYVALMELAARGKSFALGALTADAEHRPRWVQRREGPPRESLREMRELGARADADAKDSGVVG